jgi:small subunit ribosomal protein S16
MGKKKQPIYKVVAADSRSPRDGKFLESIGVYNPLTDPFTVDIKEDRALYWLDKGAQPTDTVKSLLRQKGITLKRQLIRKGLPEDKIQIEMANWEKLREAKTRSNDKGKKKSKKQNSGIENAKESSENVDRRTAEVKGAASDENPAEE